VSRQPRIGIALGGGAARGWAHIGVLQALARHGVVPEVVTGASIGALVGAAFAANRLDALDAWVRALSGLDVLKLLDARIAGGVIEGNRVMQAIERILPDLPIETLERPYAAVATDLRTGRPVWLRSGSTIAAVRASCAMPGLMPPRRHEHRWLVDGGLVDPVPVTLCRVLGADVVIAVDISAYRHRQRAETPRSPERSGEHPPKRRRNRTKRPRRRCAGASPGRMNCEGTSSACRRSSVACSSPAATTRRANPGCSTWSPPPSTSCSRASPAAAWPATRRIWSSRRISPASV
jgi:predicted acylesterase/phospholipase RssA